MTFLYSIRYGFTAVLPDSLAQNLDNALSTVIAKAEKVLPKGQYSEPLNVIHIGVSQASQAGDAFAAQAQSALQQFRPQLGSMNVRTVNFFLVNPGAVVSYYNYFSETNFAEDPISRNMRPTLPQLLEINRLAKNHDLERIVAVGRNAYMFLGREKVAAGAKSKGERPQVLFLRAFSLTEESLTLMGATRVLAMALEEIERATLDPRVSETASSRVFLNILPDSHISQEEVITRFSKIMDSKYIYTAAYLLTLY